MPQASDVKDPQLLPLNTWILGPDVFRSVPITGRLILRLFEKVEVEMVYQTSSSGVPVAQPTGIPLLAVALQTVPELFVTPLVSVTAPLQLSLAGGVA